jgi:hypothetical protein
MVVETGLDEMLVIHAMPLRNKDVDQYREARRWRV